MKLRLLGLVGPALGCLLIALLSADPSGVPGTAASGFGIDGRSFGPIGEREEHAPGRPSGAMLAMDFWAAQRAYPDRTFPRRGFYEAFVDARKNITAPAHPQAKSVWRPLGPINIGGRTLAVALNPQNPHTVYAGSASGGLWRSRTGGVGVAAWQQVPTGLPVLAVSSIAIDPGDSNRMFIGTGEVYAYQNTTGGIADRLTRGSYGIGLLRTLDGGVTWTKSIDWSYDQERGIWAVRIDPTDPDVIWVAATTGTYRSRDGGDSWDLVHSVVMANDLVIHSGDPDIVVVACGNLGSTGHGLYRTTNGGVSWTKLTQAGVIPPYFEGKAQLAISASDPDVILCSIGNGGLGASATWLLRSDDAGATWTLKSQSDYSRWQGWFSHDVAIHPSDPDTVIAAGINVWKSGHGGQYMSLRSDWTAWYFGEVPIGGPEGPPVYSHADHHDVTYHPTDPNIVYLANDGGIFRSLDGGETFEGCNGGYQTTQFYAGFSSSRSDSFLALGGMQDNSTAIYHGTGAWFRAIGGDGSWTGIDAGDDAVLYGSAQYLYLVKSVNGGLDWFEIAPPEMGAVSFIAPFVLGGPSQPDLIYAGRSYIFKSLNGGITWTNTGSIGADPALAMAVSQTNGDVCYVSTAPLTYRARLFRTVNGGASWVEITGPTPDRYPVGLAIDPTADGTLYVAYSGYGISHLWRTTDAGGVWEDLGAGLPDVPTNCVIVDPDYPDHLYVGGDLGVYVSLDRGATWHDLNQGLPDACIAMDFSISSSNRMLRVSTYGNGVYERPLFEDPVAVPDPAAGSGIIALRQNRPNPFNPSTSIAYRLGADGRVDLTIYDLAGRRVRTLVSGRREAGEHVARWDGKDHAGRNQPSGVYFYRLRAGAEVVSRRMQLIR